MSQHSVLHLTELTSYGVSRHVEGVGGRGRGFTIRVPKLCLTPRAQHGADNGQLKAKLEVLHSGRHLEGIVMKFAIKATGHNLDEGGALAHEHVIDQARTMTPDLNCRVRRRLKWGWRGRWDQCHGRKNRRCREWLQMQQEVLNTQSLQHPRRQIDRCDGLRPCSTKDEVHLHTATTDQADASSGQSKPVPHADKSMLLSLGMTWHSAQEKCIILFRNVNNTTARWSRHHVVHPDA